MILMRAHLKSITNPGQKSFGRIAGSSFKYIYVSALVIGDKSLCYLKKKANVNITEILCCQGKSSRIISLLGGCFEEKSLSRHIRHSLHCLRKTNCFRTKRENISCQMHMHSWHFKVLGLVHIVLCCMHMTDDKGTKLDLKAPHRWH